MPEPKALQKFAGGIELQDGRQIRTAQVLAPQRSAIQIWPLGAAKPRWWSPSFALGQREPVLTVRYGFGCEFGWAYAFPRARMAPANAMDRR